MTYTELASGANGLLLTATVTDAALGLNNATVLFDGSSSLALGITGGWLTVDSSAATPPNGALDAFMLPVADVSGVAISTTAGSLGTLSATGLSISSSTPTAFSSVTGSQYSFSNDSATDTGGYSFTAAAPLGGATSTGNFAQPGMLSGTVTQVSTSTIDLAQLNAIEIATFSFGSGATAGSLQLWVQPDATAKADVVFTGVAPVPLPDSVVLLLSGLGVLGIWRLRRSVSFGPSAGVSG